MSVAHHRAYNACPGCGGLKRRVSRRCSGCAARERATVAAAAMRATGRAPARRPRVAPPISTDVTRALSLLAAARARGDAGDAWHYRRALIVARARDWGLVRTEGRT